MLNFSQRSFTSCLMNFIISFIYSYISSRVHPSKKTIWYQEMSLPPSFQGQLRKALSKFVVGLDLAWSRHPRNLSPSTGSSWIFSIFHLLNIRSERELLFKIICHYLPLNKLVFVQMSIYESIPRHGIKNYSFKVYNFKVLSGKLIKIIF